MFYEISRGLKTGRQITTAQRTSPRFAEEPVVMGKVLRRGAAPIVLTEAQFRLGRIQLHRLLAAGSISIMVLDGEKRVPYDFKTGGESNTGAPASTPAPQAEEPEAPVAPPSSDLEETAVAHVEEPVVEAPPAAPEAPVEAPAEDAVVEPTKKKGRRS